MLASRADAKNELIKIQALLATKELLTQEKEVKKKIGLLDFCAEVMPQFKWDFPWQKYWIEQEDLHDHLVFSVPPQHGKSTMTTIGYVANELTNNQGLRVIIGCYNQKLANKFARKIRRILIERGVALKKDRKAVCEFELEEGGSLLAVGMLGGVTGNPCDLLVIDDPVKNAGEAKSVTLQEKIFVAFKEDFYTRVNKGGRVRITGTRWHEYDLIGRIMDDPDLSQLFTIFINLQALAEEGDVLGRNLGEPLCPYLFDKKELAKKKLALGRGFFALYQGQPTAAAGDIIKREWFRYFEKIEDLGPLVRIIQSIDTAFQAKQKNDRSVIETWAEFERGYAMLDIAYGRWEFPKLQEMVKLQYEKWKPNRVLVEDKASGQSLNQTIKKDTKIPLKKIAGNDDKESALAAQSGYFEAGLVYFPAYLSQEDKDYHEKELLMFPNAKHDDSVITKIMAIRELANKKKVDGIIDGVIIPSSIPNFESLNAYA